LIIGRAEPTIRLQVRSLRDRTSGGFDSITKPLFLTLHYVWRPMMDRQAIHVVLPQELPIMNAKINRTAALAFLAVFAFAGAAAAEDKMAADGMKPDAMHGDAMKAAPKKGDAMKGDAMKADGMKPDAMHGDAMKPDAMKGAK
jgi:pentapeptide MXKDX repeat protein